MKNAIKYAAVAALMFLPMVAFGADGAQQAVVVKKTFIQVLKEGGWCMYPIGLFSIGTVWLIIDLWIRTNAKKMTPEPDVFSAKQAFLAGDYVTAYQSMKSAISPFAKVIQAALSSVGHGKDATEEALQAEVDKVSSTLQTRVNYLSVIGVCSPMVGLLGTVSGMRGAFAALGSSGIGDTSKLAEHIGEVLIATASGLFIAIPAFMFFYILRNRLALQMHKLEDQVISLFRNMPYDHFHGLEIGEEVTYAALPNWVGNEADAAPAAQ